MEKQNQNNPTNNFIEEMRTVIRSYPPELRYPMLLELSQLLVEETPLARDAYAARMAELQANFKKFISDLFSDECGKDD